VQFFFLCRCSCFLNVFAGDNEAWIFFIIIVIFSDDARYFPACDGGFYVTAKDGTLLHVDRLGKQF